MSTPAGQVPGSEATQPEAATPLRFVTAASLFDGHDAAINIMRRLIQAQGAEVVHLGHNRSAARNLRHIAACRTSRGTSMSADPHHPPRHDRNCQLLHTR